MYNFNYLINTLLRLIQFYNPDKDTTGHKIPDSYVLVETEEENEREKGEFYLDMDLQP